MKKDVFSVANVIYINFRIYMSLRFLKLQYLVLHLFEILLPSTKKQHFNVTVIGDGFALGMGDISGGLSSHLEYLSSSDTETIHLAWKIVNRGQMFKETKEFLNSLDQVSGDIVILWMGTADVLTGMDGLPDVAYKRDLACLSYTQSEIATVVKNIVKIAIQFQKQKKRVCVIDMPTSLQGHSRGKMRRLNSQLKQLLREEASSDQSVKKKYAIHLISFGTMHRLQQKEYRAFDGIHLNRKGYKLLAKDLYQSSIKSLMTNTEWENVWKKSV